MKLRFPGKTFLLGEYLVLDRGLALLAGHGPWFEGEAVAGGNPSSPFHPESPAGRWLSAHPFSGTLRFLDPHRGAGGFGGSGAEFLTAWYAGRALPNDEAERSALAWAAWDDSRAFPGSGADILTQAFGVNYGRDFFLHVHLKERRAAPVETACGLTLSLFHTGRKLATHEALKEKRTLPLDTLEELTLDGIEAMRARDGAALASSLNGYARALRAHGHLAPHSATALDSLPRENVRAAKGCGAMGADVLAVLHAGAALDAWARANSLAEVARLPV